MDFNAGCDFYNIRGSFGVCLNSSRVCNFSDIPLPVLEATSEKGYYDSVLAVRASLPPAQFPCEWTCAFDRHHSRTFVSYRTGQWFVPTLHGDLSVNDWYLRNIPRALIPGKSVRSFQGFPSAAPKSGQPVVDTVSERVVTSRRSGIVR